MKTVGELKAFIKDLPDDMFLLLYHNDMDKEGFMTDVIADIDNCCPVIQTASDQFGDCNYKYEKFIKDKNGVLCLKLYINN